jgi:glycosyltransferase involved in cell wall biosynthesis
MQQEDVSVVIPAYNAQAFVTDALDSVMAQTCLPCEVLVVDDGSTDATAEIVRAWIAGGNYPVPVRLIPQDNAGVPVTRNLGIRNARGRWVAFLDVDDIWEPNHLERLVDAVGLVPGAVAAYGAGRLFVGDELEDRLYDEYWDNPSRQYGTPIAGSSCLRIGQDIFQRLIKGNFIKPSSLMVNKKVASDIGLFDVGLRSGEDREFLVRLIFKGDFVYFPESITRYRWHNDNLSQTKNAKRNLENGLRVLDKIVRNQSFNLEPAQMAACRSEIRSAITEYLYVCSLAGWKTYANGLGVVRSLFGEWCAFTALNPKHLAHTLTA